MADPTRVEALAASFDKLSAEPTAPQAGSAPQAPSQPGTQAPSDPASQPRPEAAENQPGSPPAQPAAAPLYSKPEEKKDPAAPAAAEQKPAPAAKPGEQPPTQLTGLKPPESWRAQIRDAHWKTLPLQVQAEIVRRERQIEGTLRQTAEARKVAEGVNGLLNQFQDVFRQEATPPMQTIANLLNISRTLRSAPPPQRAQYMAQVIQTFDVDLSLLDQALAFNVKNGPSQQQSQVQMAGIQQMIHQQLAPVQQALQGFQQQHQLQAQQQMQDNAKEIETFAADPANEYFDLVREEVADILELGAKRGQKITLQEAYTRAMLANNELAPLVSRKRVEEAAARMSAPAAQAANLSSMSVTGAPSTAAPSGGQPTTVRGSIEAAIDRLTARA